MRKIIKKILVLIIFIFTFFINKSDVYAANANISMSSDKTDLYVNEIITITIDIKETSGNLGSWKINMSHSNNLSLISGEEKIVGYGDGQVSEKQYINKYQAISSGSSNINIDSATIVDWQQESEIDVTISTKKLNQNIKNTNIKNGLITENGNTYYYINGVKQRGVQQVGSDYYFFGENTYKMFKNQFITSSINGNTYYPGEDGKLLRGQVYYNNASYFFGEVTYKLIKNQLVTSSITGLSYYASTDGKLLKGFQKINGEYYFFGENTYKMFKNQFVTSSVTGDTYYPGEDGKLLKGIQKINNDYYFFGENSGKLYQNQMITSSIDYKMYYLGPDGRAKTGFQEIDEEKYYFSPERASGLKQINDDYYFFGENSGKMYKNQMITSSKDNKIYNLGPDGKAKIGFQEINGEKYYFNPERASGLKQINNDYYFFGENSGKMYKNQIITSSITKESYYPGEDGKLLKGMQCYKDNCYFFGENSRKMYKNQIVTSDETGLSYYPGEDGKLLRGQTYYDGNYYFFGEVTYKLIKNQLVTSSITGLTYYASEDGKLKLGVQEINGKKYFFGQRSGKMYKNSFVTSLEGQIYYCNGDGIIQTGIQTIDGVDYNFGEDGVLQTGYQTINGKTYYYYLDGSIAKGVVKIQGERNYFSFTTGELLNRNVKLIADVSYANGYINWDQLWSSGQIDGVIIRVGYGTSRTDNPVIDSYFAYNIAAVKRLGIPYSIYLFGYAQTTEAATKEAQFTANWLNQYGATNLSLPIFYDAEISYWNNLNYTADVYSNTISTYANTLNSLGFGSVGVYGSYSWFAYEGGRLNSETIKKYPLWVAQYYNKCSYFGAYGWQYTSDGSLPGINGRVDLSIFF